MQIQLTWAVRVIGKLWQPSHDTRFAAPCLQEERSPFGVRRSARRRRWLPDFSRCERTAEMRVQRLLFAPPNAERRTLILLAIPEMRTIVPANPRIPNEGSKSAGFSVLPTIRAASGR